MHFPEGKRQYRAARPTLVGDVVRVNGDSWLVAKTWEHADGTLTVWLEERDADLQAPSALLIDELFERATRVRAQSEQLRADAVERRLMRSDERARGHVAPDVSEG